MAASTAREEEKKTSIRARLRKAGLSGRINTAFMERLNPSIWQCVSKLTRRTWGPAKYSPELIGHLEWWRRHRNGGLTITLSDHARAWQRHWRSPWNARANSSRGCKQPWKYRERTPAKVAGLTDRRWRVKELLSYPLP